MAFVHGGALGPEYEGTLWMGSARGFQQVGGTGGSIYLMRLTADRLHVDTSADPRLADKVADNLFRAQKFEGTESETLIVGTGFGTTPDIEQGPDGNLYVVSHHRQRDLHDQPQAGLTRRHRELYNIRRHGG